MSLVERVTGWLVRQKHKHGLADDYEIDFINNLSNYELLEAISSALEEMNNDQSKGKDC